MKEIKKIIEEEREGEIGTGTGKETKGLHKRIYCLKREETGKDISRGRNEWGV